MLNTLIYILHNLEHFILYKRASDQKLCLSTQSGLLYTISYKHNLNDLVGHRHHCNK